MAHAATNALSITPELDSDGKYLLRSEIEVLFTLRSLKQHRARLAAYPDACDTHIQTSLRNVDAHAHEVEFERSTDPRLNDVLLSASRTTLVSADDQVKVQFEIGRVRQVKRAGVQALVADVPRALLRIQRRDYYRISVSGPNAPTCMIRVNKAGVAHITEVPVLDISVGGIGLADQTDLQFEPGTLFDDCEIVLGDAGTITVSLRVVNTFGVTDANGLARIRAGCEFVDLQEYKSTLLQRYVLQLERERNAKLLRRL